MAAIRSSSPERKSAFKAHASFKRLDKPVESRREIAKPRKPEGALPRLSEQIERIAQNSLTTLLTGESGTGKTTLARLIHSSGPRATSPFVVINCATLPRELIEAELFGHAKGTFTGAVTDRVGRIEAADGGTLLLDEIGDMPLELQPKLLTFLQDQSFQRIGSNELLTADVRVVAATNQDLIEHCRNRRFREDLYFRFNVLSLQIPPLRHHRETIPVLVGQILQRIAGRTGDSPATVDPQAMLALTQYDWPGNIRELENILERACVFRKTERIQLDNLAFNNFNGQGGPDPVGSPDHFDFAGKTLSEIERIALAETLRACCGNKAKAARSLGISERSIYNKIKRHGLSATRHV